MLQKWCDWLTLGILAWKLGYLNIKIKIKIRLRLN